MAAFLGALLPPVTKPTHKAGHVLNHFAASGGKLVMNISHPDIFLAPDVVQLKYYSISLESEYIAAA